MIEDKYLPNGWNIQTIENVGSKNSSYPIGDGDHGQIKPSDYRDNGIPYIRVADMVNDKISLKKLVYIPKEIHERNLKSELHPNDVIIAKTGATIGKVAVIPRNIRVANTTASIGKITLDDEKVMPKYLLYFIKTRYFTQQMWAVSKKSAQPGFNVKDIKKFKIIVPPLLTQKKIVAILEKAEKLKEWRMEADELTDEFLKSTFFEMFGDPVKNPMGWELKKLGEIGEVSSGLTLNSQRRANKENLFPYLRVANVYRNKLDLNEIKYIHVSDLEFERFLLKKNDVLIVEGHGNIEEIGRAAIWNGEIPNCLHQNHIIKVRLNDNYISHSFLSFFLNFYGNYGYFSSKSRTTSGLNTISTNKVRKAKIPLPPVSMQKKFAEIYKTIEQLRDHQTQSHQHIDNLFNALMQQAFRGKLS